MSTSGQSVAERSRPFSQAMAPDIAPTAYQQFQHLFPCGVKISSPQSMSHAELKIHSPDVFQQPACRQPERQSELDVLMRVILAEWVERGRIWDNTVGAEGQLNGSTKQDLLEQDFICSLRDLLDPRLLEVEQLSQVVQDSLPFKMGYVSDHSCPAAFRSNANCYEIRSG